MPVRERVLKFENEEDRWRTWRLLDKLASEMPMQYRTRPPDSIVLVEWSYRIVVIFLEEVGIPYTEREMVYRSRFAVEEATSPKGSVKEASR